MRAAPHARLHVTSSVRFTPPARGYHSSTFQLNVSTLCGIHSFQYVNWSRFSLEADKCKSLPPAIDPRMAPTSAEAEAEESEDGSRTHAQGLTLVDLSAQPEGFRV
jgi:hypothetical protein